MGGIKRIYYTNGLNEIRLFPWEDIPDGWVKGGVKSTATTTHKRIYNNGVEEKFFFEGEQTDGFTLGRLPNITNSNKANQTKHKKEYHWYTNGEIEHLYSITEGIPVGWVGGRLAMQSSQKEKLSDSHKGLKRTPVTQNKINKTRKNNRKNQEFDSNDEKLIYTYLTSKYCSNDVEYHYTDNRYMSSKGVMWECDFYIRSLDLFIEYNGFPNHYVEPFNISNKDHINLLEHCKQSPKNFIEEQLVTVWAGSDVEKLQCAQRNNLNYKVYYKLNEIISE